MSPKSWSFFNPTSIDFGVGAINRIKSSIPYDRIGLITTEGLHKRGVLQRVEALLGERYFCILDDVLPNPDLSHLDLQLNKLRGHEVNALLAVGGGSCIDSAKVLARMLAQPEISTIKDSFELEKCFTQDCSLPVIAVPTTSGTGSEVTPFATVWDFKGGKKLSITGNSVYPVSAIIDPELTYSLPRQVTVTAGLDAISHALEAIWNKNANPIAIALATESLSLGLGALRSLNKNLSDNAARANMMQSSLLAGMAISNTKTALAHSISYPFTYSLGLPHGIACSFTLPELMLFNSGADDGRMKNLAQSLNYESIQHFSQDLSVLLKELNVPDYFLELNSDAGMFNNLFVQMNDLSRSMNNIRSVEFVDIKKLVLNSMEKLFN